MSLLYTHCADNHPSDSPVSWCFSDFDVMSHAPERHDYWDGWTTEQFEDCQREKGKYLAGYFSHPKYKRVNGRPVVYRGNADSLLYYSQRFSVTPQETLSLIREGSGENIYYVATNTKPEYFGLLASWGFDCFTEYLVYGNTWDEVMERYRDRWSEGVSIARRTGIKYWPAVTTGFDSRAWYKHDSLFIPTPEQFTAHVIEARKFAGKYSEVTDGQVCIEAWNEFGEGSCIEPMQAGMIHDGREMLDALIRAVA